MKNYQVPERLVEEEVEEEINLREYFLIVRKRKFVVLSVLTVVFLLTIISTFSKVPIYNSSTEVLIERNRGASGLENTYYSSYDPEFLSTQSAIITSLKVARRVVDNQKLATTYRKYFLKEAEETSSILASVKNGIKSGIRGSLGQMAALVRSPAPDGGVTNEAATLQTEPLSDEDIIALMVQGSLSVEPMKDSKIVRITCEHESPIIAKLVADAVTKAYMDEILDMKLTTSRYALQWMTAKAEEERKKLEDSERVMQQYMRENDLVTVENRLAIAPQKLSEFSTRLSQAQTDRKALEDVMKQISSAGSNINLLENIPVFAENGVLKSLRETIFKSRQNLTELSKKYGEKHPLMIKANDELRQLLSQQQAEVNRVIATTRNSFELAKSQEESLQELLDSTKKELLNLNEKFIQFSIMKRDVDSNRVVYEALTANIKKEGVTEQAQSVNVWVIRDAYLPGGPSKPNKKRSLMIGLILGLMGGIGCAFLIEYLDNTVKSEKDLETRYGLTVLGTVEQVKEKGASIESFILKKPLSPLAESYRLIRTGLLLSSAEHPPRTILITSMGPQEGKTSTTINIARVLSQGNKKVLVIDCDLRRPRVHSVFAMQNDKGLSNFLTGNTQDNIIHKIPGEDLFVISSGTIPPNPAELVSSRKMKSFVEKMAENFDFVLIDSPPIQSVTDSLALTRLVDGTIVVVRAGKTTYEMLQSGLKKLRDVQCPLLGCVLNGQKKSDVTGSYYYGYTTYYAKDSEA